MPKSVSRQWPPGRFVLRPSRIREDRIVPTGEPDLVLSLAGFLERFMLTTDRLDKLKIRQTRPGGYLGFSLGARSQRKTLFAYHNRAKNNHLRLALRADPTFSKRCQEIYRVVEADWGSRVEEISSGKMDRPTWKSVPGAGSRLM